MSGYYQETDDAQASTIEEFEPLVEAFDVVENANKEKFEIPYSIARHAEISHLCGRQYKNAQDKLYKEERERPENSYQNLLKQCTSSQTVRCCSNQQCRLHFIAKKADVKRGWAKFCSKSCKAQKQFWS